MLVYYFQALMLTSLFHPMQSSALLTPEEYLTFEAEAEIKHEYWHGRIVAMAGETPNHSTVKDNLVDALRNQRPDCMARTVRTRYGICEPRGAFWFILSVDSIRR